VRRRRRERTCDGWALNFAGKEATTGLVANVFDGIERMFGAG
jgi:hypothetical protein